MPPKKAKKKDVEAEDEYEVPAKKKVNTRRSKIPEKTKSITK